MADRSKTTALQTALGGGKVSDKAAQSALGEAVGRIANLTKRAQHSKEALVETGTVVMHAAEAQGALFLASLAEGYLGEDKIKLGSVDLRATLGLVAQGYGLYQTMTGQKGSGAHVMAAGNGLMGSWLASVARNAGRTLAERRTGTAAPTQLPMPAPAPMPIVMQGLMPEPGLAGPMREVLLTPETEGDELGRGGRGRGRGRRGRMKHRQKQREQSEDSEESLEGEEMGRRGRRRSRFVRADDDANDID